MSLSQSFRDRIAAVRQQNKATAAGLNKIPVRGPPSEPPSTSLPKKAKVLEPPLPAGEPFRTFPRGYVPPTPSSLKGKEKISAPPHRPETIRINISELPSRPLSPQASTAPTTPVTRRDDPSTTSGSTRRFGASGTAVEDSLAADSPAEDYSRQLAPSPPHPIDEIEDYLGDPTDPIEMKRKVAEMLRKHACIIQALEKGKQAADHQIDWLEVECARLSSEIDADIEVDSIHRGDPLKSSKSNTEISVESTDIRCAPRSEYPSDWHLPSNVCNSLQQKPLGILGFYSYFCMLQWNLHCLLR
ncbi:hypothetical protein KSP39_PZI011489 [Platanthera zijinensis]|uniref:Uncharacterized protein n=1 Tax=Platanthera zijinensis TaxID=2320716 RepID=A0AAP0BH62_9ASPA